ncbi:MAG: ABC transporter ATP-binding protein [Rhizobiaceae bacterium]|nr:ABC transporter ATP-binding protein [Rhizobiaceae bacterium]
MSGSILSIRGLRAGYGDFQALFGIDVDLEEGEVLALIGANGAGKSTLLKAITGLVRCERDMILYGGQPIGGERPDLIARRGIAMVPEGRRLFRSLSVEENLVIGGERAPKGEWSLDRVYGLFPILREKRRNPGTALSGGQQQMVAIGRALMANPRVLLFDEISLGLAPVVIKDIYAAFPAIAATGVSIVLVEQDVVRALAVARCFVCLQEGRVSLAGRPEDHDRAAITAAYFGAANVAGAH